MCKNKDAKIFEYLLHHNLRNVFFHIWLNSHFNQIYKNICRRINRCKNKWTKNCYTKIFCAEISDTEIFATTIFVWEIFAQKIFV